MARAPSSSPNTITLITSPTFIKSHVFSKNALCEVHHIKASSPNTGISIPSTEMYLSRCSRLQLSATETELCFKVLKGCLCIHVQICVQIFATAYVQMCIVIVEYLSSTTGMVAVELSDCWNFNTFFGKNQVQGAH